MLSRTGRFRRSDRILRSRDYQRISKLGTRTSAPAFVLLVAASPCEADDGQPRLGISASRKVGNAVTRNRVKRRVREWFRHRRSEIGRGVDVVVIARRPAATMSGEEMWSSLDSLAARARERAAKRRRAGGR